MSKSKAGGAGEVASTHVRVRHRKTTVFVSVGLDATGGELRALAARMLCVDARDVRLRVVAGGQDADAGEGEGLGSGSSSGSGLGTAVLEGTRLCEQGVRNDALLGADVRRGGVWTGGQARQLPRVDRDVPTAEVRKR